VCLKAYRNAVSGLGFDSPKERRKGRGTNKYWTRMRKPKESEANEVELTAKEEKGDDEKKG